MILCRILFIITGIWSIGLLLSTGSQANENLAELEVPQALSAGLHHFLDLTDPDKTIAFDPKKESALVIEYMKYAVGKTRADEVEELLDLK
jgi:hypothetical protein